MIIRLEDLGKKYNRQWVFRHLETVINAGDRVAITGHNGSGKSTLLKLIGGYTLPSEGKVILNDTRKEEQQIRFSVTAPYLNLIEEFTLLEHLDFHGKFKKALLDTNGICKESGLMGSEHKYVKDFSSGMKQRLRLSLSFFYESEVILLDEPTANLDQEGVNWYNHLIQKHTGDRTLIIASNQATEYEFCEQTIQIEDHKT